MFERESLEPFLFTIGVLAFYSVGWFFIFAEETLFESNAKVFIDPKRITEKKKILGSEKIFKRKLFLLSNFSPSEVLADREKRLELWRIYFPDRNRLDEKILEERSHLEKIDEQLEDISRVKFNEFFRYQKRF